MFGRTIVYSHPPRRRSGWWKENHEVSVSHHRSVITAVCNMSSSGANTTAVGGWSSAIRQYPSALAAWSSTTGMDHAVRARRRSLLRPSANSPLALIQNAAERMPYSNW